VASAEQYAVTEEGEAGAAVHLSLDRLGLGVDSLGPAVVVRQGERGGGSLDVQVEAPGEGVQVREINGVGGGDPLLKMTGVVRVRGQQGGEGADEAGQAGHLRAGAGEAGEQRLLASGEAGGPGGQEPGRAAGRQVRPVGLEPGGCLRGPHSTAPGILCNFRFT
jgi:hypothetical protein